MENTGDYLDYGEEEMDEDFEEEEMKAAEEAIKDQDGSNSHFNTTEIEFYYTPGGRMQCPIDECSNTKFASKGKFQRHWEEKHEKNNMKYLCTIGRCTAECRRRYDLKIHMKMRHEMRDDVEIEEAMNRCQKVVSEKRGFVNPGLWTFRGKTLFPSATVSSVALTTSTTSRGKNLLPTTAASVSSTSTAHSATFSTTITTTETRPVPATSATSSSTSAVTCTTSTVPTVTSSKPIQPVPSIPSAVVTSAIHKADSQDQPEPEFTVHLPSDLDVLPRKKLTIQEYQSRPRQMERSDTPCRQVKRKSDTPCGYTSSETADASTQTTARHYSPLHLPAIPHRKEELEDYIKWLCLCMDDVGRTREIAMERLQELRKDGTRLEQERNQRRQLEAENRRLKRELAEIKWKNTLFQPREPPAEQ